MGRFIVIVLDGFGVGCMEDAAIVRPADVGAHTWRHIAQATPGLRLPRLEALGLMNIADFETDTMRKSPAATFSRAALTHFGADTFWGHQEIMGTRPRKPVEEPFAQRLAATRVALEEGGFHVEVHTGPLGGQLLIVNGAVTVADNIECDPGQAINVTAAIDDIPFEDVLKIGRVVRTQVFVSRVIAFGGRGVHLPQMLAAIEEQPEARLIGVNAPASGVYNDDYHCVHMGYGVDAATQVATILPHHGVPVFLVGKVADIVENPQPEHSFSLVPTPQVMEKTLALIEENPNAFFCTNVQETDLCGHRENVGEYVRILREADEGLEPILAALAPEDILVVMADHGNDPTIGHPHHTREYVPLMVRGGSVRPGAFPVRTTLSDVGATVADYFGVPAPENGTSFLGDFLNKEFSFMDVLDQRLQILNQSGLLSDQNVRVANALRVLFLKRYGIELTEENSAAFFTHFCMALHRLETGEEIDPINPLIFDEIQDQYDYENADLIADELGRYVVTLPAWERGYLLTHLLVVLGNVRKAYDEEIVGQG